MPPVITDQGLVDELHDAVGQVNAALKDALAAGLDVRVDVRVDDDECYSYMKLAHVYSGEEGEEGPVQVKSVMRPLVRTPL